MADKKMTNKSIPYNLGVLIVRIIALYALYKIGVLWIDRKIMLTIIVGGYALLILLSSFISKK